MVGSCLLYCRLRCCRREGKGGGGVTGSYCLNFTLRLCRTEGMVGLAGSC